MRIAINTRFLLKNKMEGFGWFTYETVKRIVQNHPEHEFIFLFDRDFDDQFIFSDNITPVVIGPPARHPILFKIWFDRSVTKALKKHRADIFLSPDGYLSLKTDVPQIAVIHDLNFEHYPQDLPKGASNYLRKYFPKFAIKASRIVTVSQYSKQDIAATYKIDPSKIVVAHNGASDQFRPIDKEQQSICRKIYAKGNPFFLFVGALHPRKNIDRLLEAFDLFKKETNSETQLVIVGEELWRSKKMKSDFESLQYKEDIQFTGHLSLEELTVITGSARALTFVSYFEGFGIPLVEAMQAGCPIIASDKTSLPEVAGDAALYVDPFSVESIKDGMNKMDSDPDLREGLIDLGLKRSENFSWDRSAEIIWETIESELSGKNDKNQI